MSIICDVNLFVANQTIYYDNKAVAKVTVEDLPSCLAGLCYNLNCYNVKLKGPKDYLEEIVKETLAIEAETYSINKINIEVL